MPNTPLISGCGKVAPTIARRYRAAHGARTAGESGILGKSMFIFESLQFPSGIRFFRESAPGLPAPLLH